MNLASDVLQADFNVLQLPSEVLRALSEVLRNFVAQQIRSVAQHFKNPKCCALTHCGRGRNREAQHCNTSIYYFYQKREKRMEQERKAHAYRGEFMAALRTVAAAVARVS